MHPLSEAEVRTQRIDPALRRAGWDFPTQVREEYYVNEGRVRIKRGKGQRGQKQYVDYLLCIRLGIPIALIDAEQVILQNPLSALPTHCRNVERVEVLLGRAWGRWWLLVEEGGENRGFNGNADTPPVFLLENVVFS